jgi:hypothetical protein
MKTTDEIIDYLNKSNQENYVELNYDDEWSFISQKLVKNFIKDINKNKKNYTLIDYENETWFCDELKTKYNIVILNLKKFSNEYFIKEFENFEKVS